MMYEATRRDILKFGGHLTLAGVLATIGLLKPVRVYADWNKEAFDTENVDNAIQALGGKTAAENEDIEIVAAEIAENGAVVPVSIRSNIPNTESISILAERNPRVLVAKFDIPPGTEPSISTRIKMQETANVYGLVKADGKFYKAAKEIKVTLGGC